MRTTSRIYSSHDALPFSFTRQVNLYSLSAAAAGVSILALAAPAEGEVIVTKKTIPIPITQFGQPSVGISLSNNGINDFYLHLLSTFSGASTRAELDLAVANGPDGKGIMGTFKIGGYHVYASALARGARIGSSDQFAGFPFGVALEVSYTTFSRGHRLLGKWGGDPKNRYLGVRFSLDGKMHFGWIRLTVNTDKVAGMSATITGYAYETVPNKAILAGNAESSSLTSEVDDNYHSTDGPSLGVLALGVTGLSVWRRDQNVF